MKNVDEPDAFFPATGRNSSQDELNSQADSIAPEEKKLHCPFSSDEPNMQAYLDLFVEAETLKDKLKEMELSNTEPKSEPPLMPSWLGEKSNPLDFLSETQKQQPIVAAPENPGGQLVITNPFQSSPSINFHGSRPGATAPGLQCFDIQNGVAPYRGFGAVHVKDIEATDEYSLMEKTVAAKQFATVNGTVFMYNGKYYERLNPEDIPGEILDICRADVIQIGKYTPVKNAGKLLQIDKRFKTPEEFLEYGRQFITFQNGNLNLEDGMLYSHSPDVFTTYTIQANYLGQKQNCLCPTTHQLFQTVACGDPLLVERIWQIVGYCLTSDVSAKCGILFQGVPSSGKSLLANFLASFFPKDKVAALSIHDLGQRFAAAELDGIALCISPDMPSKPLSETAVGMIKALSGNDLVAADRKYRSFAKFHFAGKFVMCSNHPLVTKMHDPAFQERIVTVPYAYSIPRSQWDTKLLEKLKAERDVVATLAIDAYYRLRKNHYIFAGDFPMNAIEPLFNQQSAALLPDLMMAFVKQYFEPAKNGIVYVFDAYSLFQKTNHIPVSLPQFGNYFGNAASQLYNAVSSRGRRSKNANPTSCLLGIKKKELP